MVKEYSTWSFKNGSDLSPNPNYVPPASVTDPRDSAPEQLKSLTLTPRGVLIARVPEHTPMDEMDAIKIYLSECFPNNRVVVLWNNITLSVIEDESCRERMTSNNGTANYY